MASTYTTKKGTMHQVNLSVHDDINTKFNELCDGDSKSVVFAQWVKEKHLAKFGVQPAAPTVAKKYNILGQTN
jgi:hypothetical protein